MGENETRFLSLSGQGFQLIRGTVMAEKKEFIRIRGARENNLKALNVDIPRNQFVVFETGCIYGPQRFRKEFACV